MNWLPVITLPDGTTIEMPVPTSEDVGHGSVHGYRVTGSDGITEFATLTEVVDHVLSRGRRQSDDDPLTATSALPPAAADQGEADDRPGPPVE